MNAAFLLVTGAMLVGQPGDKKPAPAPATPVVAASCGNDCGCDSFGHRFRDRLKGLFNRGGCCDSCQPACCDHKHRREPLFHSRCEEACKPRLWTWEPRCREATCHQHCAKPACHDDCGRGGFNLLERLRAGFHRRDACCDTGCATTTTTAPAKGGEKIDAPKKMPGGDKKPAGDKKPQEVRIESAPTTIAPSTLQVSPAPAIEIAPPPAVPAPRLEGVRRDPF